MSEENSVSNILDLSSPTQLYNIIVEVVNYNEEKLDKEIKEIAQDIKEEIKEATQDVKEEEVLQSEKNKNEIKKGCCIIF